MNGKAIYFFRVGNTDKTDSEGRDLGLEYDKIWTHRQLVIKMQTVGEMRHEEDTWELLESTDSFFSIPLPRIQWPCFRIFNSPPLLCGIQTALNVAYNPPWLAPAKLSESFFLHYFSSFLVPLHYLLLPNKNVHTSGFGYLRFPVLGICLIFYLLEGTGLILQNPPQSSHLLGSPLQLFLSNSGRALFSETARGPPTHFHYRVFEIILILT